MMNKTFIECKLIKEIIRNHKVLRIAIKTILDFISTINQVLIFKSFKKPFKMYYAYEFFKNNEVLLNK